jgi:hypothetical protein
MVKMGPAATEPVPFSRLMKKLSVCRLLKKTQRQGARKIDPSAFAQDRLVEAYLGSTSNCVKTLLMVREPAHHERVVELAKLSI